MECLASSYGTRNDGHAVFMHTERALHEDTYPVLSCADIEDLLARFLPRPEETEEEVISLLEQRHHQRKKSIKSHARSQVKYAESASFSGLSK